MPSFYRKNTRSSSPVSAKRHFIVSSRSAAPKKTTAPKKTAKVEAAVDVPVVQSIDIPVPIPPSPVQTKKTAVKADVTLQTLSGLFNDNKIQPIPEEPRQPKVVEAENAVYEREPDPDEFNGLSSAHEEKELYSEAVVYERKKARAYEEQVKLLEQEKEAERKALEKEIRILKQELHRTAPIQDNKFFSLSKQLRDAIQEIENIASGAGLPTNLPPVNTAPVTVSVQLPTPSQPAAQPVSQASAASAQPPSASAPAAEAKQLEPPPTEKKELTKKKTLITGAAAVGILVIISSTLIISLTSKPKVDEKLVSKYMAQQTGQVQGIQTNAAPAGQGAAAAPDDDPSQKDITFEQATWDQFNDTMFGVNIQYPKNAVKPIRTDSNVTFIRKTGYLFKVQRIETALTLEEYWKQIKATSLNYKTSDDKFKGKPALKLELEDPSDYPGNRTLVKEGNFIYDIWTATPSKNFTKDDIMLAEKMFSSLSITGAK